MGKMSIGELMELPLEDLAKIAGGAGNKDNEERFYSLIERKFGILRRDITPGSRLGDLGRDSLDVVDVITSIQDRL